MQTMTTVVRGEVRSLALPAPDAPLSEGVCWGRFDHLFTPAFWRGQVWQHQLVGAYEDNRLGRSLREEVAACVLGGFGMPAALGLAAYAGLRGRGLLEHPTEAELAAALMEPFQVGGQAKKYRFPRQKARLLAAALAGIDGIDEGLPDRALRDALMALPGVGPKTASWVVRNLRGSDAVAILDVHIVRAGRLAGVLPTEASPQRHYLDLEGRFLRFAAAIGVRASVLDAVIWDYMRRLPRVLIEMDLEAHNRDSDRLETRTAPEGLDRFAPEQP